jgi:hypothetical protein
MCDIVAELDSLKDTIVREVVASFRASLHKSSYTIVWRDLEDQAIEALCKILKTHIKGLNDKNFERGIEGKEKNRLADLAVLCNEGNTALAIKTARGSDNPENDLGTFRQYPEKKRLFNASFDLWIRYDQSNGKIRIDKIFFDRSYKFVGKSQKAKGGVKYRKKDGNMRPKSWAMFNSGKTFWNTEVEFEEAMLKSIIFRANALVEEHLEAMTEEDQRILYERLKLKFGD